MGEFLQAIPQAATSPLALIAYLAALFVWLILGWRTLRLNALLRRINQFPEEARHKVVQSEMNAIVPDSISPADWLNEKRQRYVFIFVMGVFSTAILAIVVVAVVALVLSAAPPTTLQPTETPLLVDPAALGETLILVGSFDDRSGAMDQKVEVMRRTYTELVDLADRKDLPGVRIEWIPEPLITRHEEARALGQRYGAKLVIWGWRDSTGAFVHGTPTTETVPVPDSREYEIAPLNQTTVPVCLDREATAQGAYLAFVTLGEALIEWEDRQRVELATSFINTALEGIEQRPTEIQCSAFNPWNAYAIRGHLYGTIAKFLAGEGKQSEAISLREEAIRSYDRSIELKGDQTWVWFSKGYSQGELAGLLAQAGQTEEAIALRREAIASYAAALAIAPQDADAWYRKGVNQGALAELLAQAGQTEEAIALRREAIASYEAALAIDDQYASAWYSKGYSQSELAGLLAQAGQTEEAIALRREAIASYTSALTINPDYRAANYNRGTIYKVLEEWEPMYADFNTVVQAEPENYGAYLNRGIAASRLGRTQEAAADLRKAMALAQEQGASWYVEQAQAELARLGVE